MPLDQTASDARSPADVHQVLRAPRRAVAGSRTARRGATLRGLLSKRQGKTGRALANGGRAGPGRGQGRGIQAARRRAYASPDRQRRVRAQKATPGSKANGPTGAARARKQRETRKRSAAAWHPTPNGLCCLRVWCVVCVIVCCVCCACLCFLRVLCAVCVLCLLCVL